MTELSVPSSLPHDDAVREPFARLSAREFEVLEMMSMGFTNAEIAEQLDVSVHAVKFHLAAIYRKLGVTNRTEATSMYLSRLGIGAARPSEMAAVPKTSGRDGNGGGVDLRLIGHVLWRFKPLVILGLVVGIGLAILAYGRQTEEFASYSTVFVTQQGFPWGRLTLDPTTGSVTAPGSSQFADPVRLSSLAILYSRLADSDPIRQIMLKDGPIEGRVEAAPLLASDNQDDALPLISIAGISGSQEEAQALAQRTTTALVTYLADQQDENAIPVRDRVEIQVVNKAGPAKVLSAKSYTLPIVVLLAVLLGVVALSLILANLLPESRKRKRKGKDDSAAGDGDAPADDVADGLPVTGSGSAA